MVDAAVPVSEIWSWLAEIADPEIPVISILDLGIVRDVVWARVDDRATLCVTVTPTYSGCPAIGVIEREIVALLRARGIAEVTLAVAYAPAWTTDWLTAQGRENLRAYGISPPRLRAAENAGDAIDLTRFADERAACPRCGSDRVTLTSRFGSTPCKALYACASCKEPFDHFKSH
jgi:ring-1,2-phenylacetyl-CoA epoxidase subunit PaaD